MNYKVIYLEKFQNLLLYVYWKNRVGKISSTSDQLLIYWTIHISRDNLQEYNIWFLNCLSKLSSITQSRVINAIMLFLQFYCCIVMFLEFSSTVSSHILHSSHKA